MRASSLEVVGGIGYGIVGGVLAGVGGPPPFVAAALLALGWGG